MRQLHKIRIDGNIEFEFEEFERDFCQWESHPFPDGHCDLKSIDALVSSHPDFMYLFNSQHRFSYVSPSLLHLWGKALPEVIGKNFEEIGYPADLVKLHEIQLQLVFQGKCIRGENSFRDKNGKVGYYEYIFVPVFKEKGIIEAVAGITRDITQRKFAEEERAHFLSALAHDLRTPLSTLRMIGELLKYSESKTERKVDLKELAEQIIRNTKRLDSYIHNFLDSSRLRTGKRLQLNIEKFDLKFFLEEAVYELKALYGKQIKLVNWNDPLIGQWDKEAMHRILENLISNAVKYGERGTPIEVSLSRLGAFVFLEVHNKGEPISQEDQTDLFRLFSRTKNAIGKSEWGIGLAVVAGLVEAHEGEVSVISEKNRGTSFFVKLPIL